MKKMKMMKRFLSVMMAAMLCLMSFPTMAFAKESNQPAALESDDDGIISFTIMMTSNYDSSNDYRFDGNRLNYNITVTDLNGQPVAKSLSVRLWDGYGNMLVNSTVGADGATRTVGFIPITPGEIYFFEFVLVNGANSNLKVTIDMYAFYR